MTFTAKGLAYSINQEEYLKVFLADGEVPIDDSASERALRNFTIGRKNWVAINTVRGAHASAVIYSLTETARANNLNVYYYIKLLRESILLPDSMIFAPIAILSAASKNTKKRGSPPTVMNPTKP